MTRFETRPQSAGTAMSRQTRDPIRLARMVNEILALSDKIDVKRYLSGSQSDWSPIIAGNAKRIHASQKPRHRRWHTLTWLLTSCVADRARI